MTLKVGDSYYSLRRDDFNRPNNSVWEIPIGLLPLRYAPIEKQLRVFVNQTEYAYDDKIDPARTTQVWTAQEVEVTGAPCWGVRFTFSPLSGSSGADIAEFAIWTNGIYRTTGELGLPDNASYDGDVSTDKNFTALTTTETFSFSQIQYVTKVGWSRPVSGSRWARNMEVQINTGTPDSPTWTTIGTESGLTGSDYPSFSSPYNPETDLRTFEPDPTLVRTVQAVQVTITPALALNSDRLTVIRETRQDRPWVGPVAGGYAYGESLHWFWMQQLFIHQELCEISEVAPLIGLPPAELIPNDYSAGNQTALGVNDGTSRSTIDYSGIELLEGIPGAPSDPAHQLVVEAGNTTNNNSTWWSTVNTADYTINSSTKVITLDSGVTADIRARRVTRKDRLWVDISSVGLVPWNTSVITLIQRQMRFLSEEACILPVLFAGHPLTFPIFPRAWNWLNFVGGGGSFTFGGPYWGGDGSVIVYQNDVPLTEGTDYTVNWPEIVLNTPAGSGDTISIGGAGGGFSLPGSGGGGFEPDSGGPVPTPPAPQVPRPFVGNDADLGFTLEISAAEESVLSGGTWEGGTNVVTTTGNAPGDPFAPLYLKVKVEVTDPDDPLFGHSGVLYFSRYCGTGTAAFAVAAADDTTGDDNYDQVDSTSAGLGCLDSTATTSQDLVRAKMALFSRDNINAARVDMVLALTGGMDDADIAGDLNNVPLMGAWVQLAQDSIAAEDAGVVGNAGFTAEQFNNYIDPDVDFDDFEIPVP